MHCVDQPAQVLCDKCGDSYCEVCFAALHRKGTRRDHKARPLPRFQVKEQEESANTRVNVNGKDKVWFYLPDPLFLFTKCFSSQTWIVIQAGMKSVKRRLWALPEYYLAGLSLKPVKMLASGSWSVQSSSRSGLPYRKENIFVY